ncbi:hypothetical protein [Vannielia litorea]|uniref:hypothetical protein n=1 Tax=Vannielia litorea TaxID=1217970 RepID=UPI001BCF2346|nr:hypothetical protein [Vannielia litorea]MBS8226167.1 hypothetical protein [Vannielia litorea]
MTVGAMAESGWTPATLRRGILGALAVGLAACAEANHLGNPLLLPVHGVATGLENVAYGKRRAAVKAWISEHEVAMRAERFEGPVTAALLAELPQGARAQVQADLKEAAHYGDFAERATVAFMVHQG